MNIYYMQDLCNLAYNCVNAELVECNKKPSEECNVEIAGIQKTRSAAKYIQICHNSFKFS